ncbi:hypothetical protein BDZ97DRAFT_1787451 [Flammula alnicola]|nr:hypothetical protein BDZ97DRAFT_1787451 [Flammula alnicola]
MLNHSMHFRRQSLHGCVVIRSFLRRNSSFPSTPGPARRFHLGNSLMSGVVSGVVCGGILVGAGYAWYHYSGVKHAIDTVKPALFFLKETQEELGKEAPSQVLGYLREAAKAYVSYFPGAGFLVDRIFDAIDDAVDTHAPEANTVIKKAYDDILEVVQRDGNMHKAASASDILSIAQNLLNDLTALGVKVGQPISKQLELERRIAELGATTASFSNAVKSQSLEGIAEKVKNIVESPEISRTLEDVAKKAKNLFSPKSDNFKKAYQAVATLVDSVAAYTLICPRIRSFFQ